MNHFTSFLCFITICCLFLSSCEKKGKVVRINQDEFSPEEQQLIGTALHQSIVDQSLSYAMLDHTAYTALYQYLNEHFETISNTASVEHRRQFDWQVTVLEVDSPSHCFRCARRLFLYYSRYVEVT